MASIVALLLFMLEKQSWWGFYGTAYNSIFLGIPCPRFIAYASNGTHCMLLNVASIYSMSLCRF